jgi:hypothetical protein
LKTVESDWDSVKWPGAAGIDRSLAVHPASDTVVA